MIAAVCWTLLALVHLPPAAGLFSQRQMARLYGGGLAPAALVLMRHRAAMFLGFVILCATAALHEEVRPVAAAVVGLSVAAFPVVWLRGGAPAALRTIAIVDLAALPPLALVAADLFVPLP